METVIIYDYKEPLRKNEQGFGYLGCVSGTEDGTKIECHICGVLKSNLSQHIITAHKMQINDYKDTYGIARSTKLISPTYRQERLDSFNARFTKEQLEEGRKKGNAKIQEMMRNGWRPEKNQAYRLETKNVRGTCPDQLLAKIKELTETLGQPPTEKQLMEYAGNTFAHAIRRTFGTYGAAVRLATFHTIKAGNRTGKKFKHLSDAELLERLRVFRDAHGRRPSCSDLGQGVLPDRGVYARRFGSFSNALAMV